MKIAAGTVIDKKTGVVRDIDASVKRGEKRMIQHGKNLSLHFDVGELLLAQRIFIDDFESEAGVLVLSEAAEKDSAEISGAEVAEKLEMAEVEAAVGGKIRGGFNGGPVRVPPAVRSRMERERNGGAGTGLVEAES